MNEPSEQAAPPAAQPDIPNYLVFAILTIFCCWPLAIPAIIFAAKVNGLVAQGDIEGARDASAKAKKFAMIALIIGIVFYVVIGGIYGIAIGVAVANA